MSSKRWLPPAAELAIEKTDAGWKVYGREVKAFDGTTVKMADTKANQEYYPQQIEMAYRNQFEQYKNDHEYG